MKVQIFARGELLTNTYFCTDESTGEAIIIDPGLRPDLIYAKIREKDLKVKYILLTHGHFDHALGCRDLKEATGAPVCVHFADAEMLSDPEKNSANVYYGFDCDYPAVVPDITFSDGDTFPLGENIFRVVHTPGHTGGSCVFVCGEYLFSGDTVFSDGFGRTDLYGGDFETLASSIEKLRALGGSYKLCPGHGSTRASFSLKDLAFY